MFFLSKPINTAWQKLQSCKITDSILQFSDFNPVFCNSFSSLWQPFHKPLPIRPFPRTPAPKQPSLRGHRPKSSISLPTAPAKQVPAQRQKKKRRITGVPHIYLVLTKSPYKKRPRGSPFWRSNPAALFCFSKKRKRWEPHVKSPSLSLTTFHIQFGILQSGPHIMRGLSPSPLPSLWRASALPSAPWSTDRSDRRWPYPATKLTSKYLRATL